ncbi:putative transport protein [Gordonia amicalis NBRC 100051 = JCM 11271]|nr:putative transport protein [Gordonia amicalis NBRC 100051 = JCM 11271]
METVGIYLVVIFGCGFLARLIRLPTLVGYLAAGFILHAPGIEQLPIIDTLAELGVTILLFTIGLKLDLRMLFRREVLLTTALNLAVILGLTIGFLGLLSTIGVRMLMGESWQTLALLGFALSFSSTVFVVRCSTSARSRAPSTAALRSASSSCRTSSPSPISRR